MVGDALATATGAPEGIVVVVVPPPPGGVHASATRAMNPTTGREIATEFHLSPSRVATNARW